MMNEQQLINKTKELYQEVIAELPKITTLPRKVKFSEYSPEQISFLRAVLKDDSALFLHVQLLNAQQQTITLTDEELEKFDPTLHLDWSLQALSLNITHAAIWISLCFQEDLKVLLVQHRTPRQPILDFKNLAILLFSLCMIGASFYLFNQVPEWLVSIVFAVGFLGLCWLYDAIKTYVQYDKKEFDHLQTLHLAHYFAEHLEDYASPLLHLDSN